MNHPRRSTALTTIALLISLAGSATGSEFYVSSGQGDDANAGTSPGAAWKTLTHALASVPLPGAGQTQTIHVAPGWHGASMGEVFPLTLGPGLQVVGDSSPGATVVDGEGAPVTLFAIFADTASQTTPVGPETLLESLVLRDAALGVNVSSDWITCEPTLSRLRITDMTSKGVSIATASPFGAGTARPTLREVWIRNTPLGVLVTEATEFGQATALMEDCIVRSCTTSGVRVESGGHIAEAVLLRTRVEQGLGAGVSGWCVNRGSARVALEDALVAGNSGHGVEVIGQNAYGGSASISLVRSTVADNGGTGVRAEMYYSGAVHLSSTVIHGNGDDLDDATGAGVFSASHCNIGDGDFAGQQGCFSEPPGFVSAPNGDYRLRFGSACVDRGDPADAVELPDLGGVVRPLDGDLDTELEVDVGAHELATLIQVGDAWPGGSIELDLLGPAGGNCALYFSRSGLAPAPVTTVYGELHIPLPPESKLIGVFPVAEWSPARVSVPVPPIPGLTGEQVAFQGLTTSPHAGISRALTSPAAVEIVAAP